MARGRTKRVMLNRGAIDGINLAIADGLHAVGVAIVTEASAHAPDSPYDPWPIGEGLLKQGGVLTYVNGQKVNGVGLDGKQPRKPRAAAVKQASHRGITTIAGFGFPARFVEFGTVDTPAQPFFTPAFNSVIPRIVPIVKQAAAYRIKRLRG